MDRPMPPWLWKMDLDMQVTPAIFDYKGRELMVTASKECRVFLLDTKAIGAQTIARRFTARRGCAMKR